MLQLPPARDVAAAERFVADHLGGLVADEVRASPRFRGGQTAADAALAALDVTGYAARRNEVWPPERRGATAVSPYVRHGLLSLPELWDAVADAPARDRAKYRDELLWQEYARHLYARLGGSTREGLRYALAGRPVPGDHPGRGPGTEPGTHPSTEPGTHSSSEPGTEPGTRPSTGPTTGPGSDAWDRSMACLEMTVSELEQDGYLVNQTRMWLASHWAVRVGADWRDGEDRFFRHLLDGSRAANRAGWQWTVGTATGKPYGFSRWQVTKRAPGLCATCPLEHACPIEDWPEDPPLGAVDADPRLRHDPDPATTAGPAHTEVEGEPEVVWLTAESLGDGDPALVAHPELPAVFVFDAPLLERLRLSAKRLVFLTETLAELADQRPLTVHLGAPTEVLRDRRLAVTWAPVPGFRRRAAELEVVARHPWPWLRRPHGGSVTSFSAWRRALDRSRA